MLHWKKEQRRFESAAAMPGDDDETGKREKGRVHQGRYCRGSARGKTPAGHIFAPASPKSGFVRRLHAEGAPRKAREQGSRRREAGALPTHVLLGAPRDVLPSPPLPGARNPSSSCVRIAAELEPRFAVFTAPL